MATNFPNGIDIAPPLRSSDYPMTQHNVDHKNLEDAVEAIERKVGIDNSSDTNSLDYKVRQLQNFVNNFDEVVEDKIGTKIVAGQGINVSYDDNTGNTTISTTSTSIGSGVIWTEVNGTRISDNQFTFQGSSELANQIIRSLFTCTSFSGGEVRYGYIKSVYYNQSTNTITCTVVSNTNLAANDKDFAIAITTKIDYYTYYINILGDITPTSTANNLLKTNYSAILLPFNVYVDDIRDVNTVIGLNVNANSTNIVDNTCTIQFGQHELQEYKPLNDKILNKTPLKLSILGLSGSPSPKNLQAQFFIVPYYIYNFRNNIPWFTGKGYGMGGSSNNGYSNEIDAIVFSNETSQSLSVIFETARQMATGCSSSTKGYGLGGWTGTALSEIDAIVFANETSQSLSATFTTARAGAAGCSSSTKGYGLGGYDNNNIHYSEIDAIVFANETSQSLSATISVARSGGCGVSSSTNGYCMSGGTMGWLICGYSPTSNIDLFSFSNETTQLLSATFTTARSVAAGTQSSLKGYGLGGITNCTTSFSEIDAIVFSNNTSQSLLATFTARGGAAGCSSLSKGYGLGGISTHIRYSEIDAIVFTNETSQSLSATFTTARAGAAGVQFVPEKQDDNLYGYTMTTQISFGKGYGMSGWNNGQFSEIDAIVFSNETSQSLSATFETARDSAAGCSSSIKGYGLGGNGPSSEIDAIVFANETSQSLSATFTTARIAAAGVSSSTKGYGLGGGAGSTHYTEIDAIIFSNESSQSLSSTISVARSGGCGVSSSTNGYCMGGGTSSWWYEGSSPTSNIDLFSFSNETTQLLSATFTTARAFAAGTQSSSKGYGLGGRVNNTTLFSEIDAIVFSDNTSQSLSATFTTARGVAAGVSSLIKGYGLGGITSTVSSEIDAIVFSNETSQSLSATFTTARAGAVGVQYNI